MGAHLGASLEFCAMKSLDPLTSGTPTNNLPISGGKDLPGFHQVLGYRQVSWSEGEAVIELDVQA